MFLDIKVFFEVLKRGKSTWRQFANKKAKYFAPSGKEVGKKIRRGSFFFDSKKKTDPRRRSSIKEESEERRHELTEDIDDTIRDYGESRRRKQENEFRS